ncbi:MAG: RloB domain-containing protein [Phycisphaeraceae bacterium]|nr:MAG: RloB domain-containing protein [Phycisphaeraceae bacterium]
MARPRRTFRERRPKPVWVIACEDAVSAQAYFQALNRLFSSTVSLILAKQPGHKSSPAQVVERAAGKFGDLSPSDHNDDRAWAVFDAEPQRGNEHKNTIDHAVALGRKMRVAVVVSNPCYEHWLRLHIGCCDGGFGSSREVVEALKCEWRREFRSEYVKGRTDPSRLVTVERLDAAVERALAQHAQQDKKRAHRCRPCVTELYQLVEELKKLDEAGPE